MSSLFRLLVCILFCTAIEAHASDFWCIRGPHSLTVGPEVYYTHRTREGGSKQKGVLYGGEFCYERLRRSALYWGVEGYYAAGTLKGHDGVDRKIRSKKQDMEIEGRLGYSLKWCWSIPISFTPYFCGGYFQEINQFVEPTPLTYKIKDYFPFIGAGFLSRFYVTPTFSVGVNFKANYMLGAKSRITDSSLDESIRLIIEDKFFYEVELPLTYSYCIRSCQWETSFVPFFRYRQYGHHEGFPFDYLETRYQIYGAKLLWRYIF